ncbi:hypothetical protein MKW94_024202 [Papaver nudicaule]|uniref:Uncharacterized protein n=1 Tax=Papaver nudicaule TaxID=74823 RepID=A0AA42AQE1_PAPNU|nr:hypothetical protein [Papaver nudicaule]
MGLNKGHTVTTKERTPRPSSRKRNQGVLFVGGLIGEVAGFAPYEKGMTELL